MDFYIFAFIYVRGLTEALWSLGNGFLCCLDIYIGHFHAYQNRVADAWFFIHIAAAYKKKEVEAEKLTHSSIFTAAKTTKKTRYYIAYIYTIFVLSIFSAFTFPRIKFHNGTEDLITLVQDLR